MRPPDDSYDDNDDNDDSYDYNMIVMITMMVNDDDNDDILKVITAIMTMTWTRWRMLPGTCSNRSSIEIFKVNKGFFQGVSFIMNVSKSFLPHLALEYPGVQLQDRLSHHPAHPQSSYCHHNQEHYIECDVVSKLSLIVFSWWSAQ